MGMEYIVFGDKFRFVSYFLSSSHLLFPRLLNVHFLFWLLGSVSCANMAHSCNISHKTTGLPSRISPLDVWCPGSLGWDTFHENGFSQTFIEVLYKWDSFILGVGREGEKTKEVSRTLVLHLETQWDLFNICVSKAHCAMCSHICLSLMSICRMRHLLLEALFVMVRLRHSSSGLYICGNMYAVFTLHSLVAIRLSF